MITRTAPRFFQYVLAATVIGTIIVGGSVWAKSFRAETGSDARIDVQLLSLNATKLPMMTVEQPF